MPATHWEDDFRYDAIIASQDLIPRGRRDYPFAYDVSFCLPAKEFLNTGLTYGKIALATLGIAGLCVLAGGWILYSGSADEGGPDSTNALMGAALLLLGFLLFTAPAKLIGPGIRILLGQRGRETRRLAPGAKAIGSELAPTGKNQEVSIENDDTVLTVFDRDEHRLMIEGTNARYQVQAEDVLSCKPFLFMNYLGVEIRCQIDPETELAFTLANATALAAYCISMDLPRWSLFWVRNPLFTHTLATVGQDLVGGVRPSRERYVDDVDDFV